MLEALGLKQKKTALPRVPSAPPGARPATALPARPPLMPDAPRTIARPAGDDQTLVPEQATTAGFVQRIAQSTAGEPQPPAGRAPTRGVPLPEASAPPPLASLFTSNSDFVRAFVMQEILQPPRALRPHAPVFAPAPAAQPPSSAPAQPAD